MPSDRPTPLNISSLCQRYDIPVRGVIHVGAHEGQELDQYLELGAQKVLLIEANPQIFQKLQTIVADIPNVIPLNYAICDREGSINLRLNAYDFSSSILPLKQHRDIYPNMLEVGEVSVAAKTLDRLITEQDLNKAAFNVLVLDIQGAELLALKGSEETLKTVDAIYSEVNLQELYEGCALIEQIDEFLTDHSFQRVAIKTPFHPFYGDAFYVKTDILAKTQTTIITSIAPKPLGKDLENQQLAIKGWRSHGFKVISLNSTDEVNALQPLYPHVIFHPVTRHAAAEVGKPLVYLEDIFDFLKNELPSNGIYGIINADIHLKLDFDYQTLIEKEAKQSLVISSRVEVKDANETTGQIYTRGFDAFFFDAHLLDKIPKSDYCLGMPWWDFWLPLVAQQQNISVKYLAGPIAYHVQHKNNYSDRLWEKYGLKFTQIFQPDRLAALQQIQQNSLLELRSQLIGIIDSFLQSFHQQAQRLYPMSTSVSIHNPANINLEAAELHCETGDIYREQGKLAEAIASYQKALTNNPNYGLAYLGLAKIHLSQGLLELATEAISHIQALKPELLNAELYIQYGKLLSQKSKSQEAIQQLQYGLNLTAQSPNQISLALEGYLLIGDIFLKQDNLEAAISNYQQAIAIDPKSAKAHWQLAQSLQQLSLSHQQDALDIEPSLIEVSAHFELGLNYSSQGKSNWAIRAYQRAIRLKPDWADAYCNLGNVLSSVGRIDEAIKNFKKAIALNPNLIEAYSNLGNALVKKGEIAEGINYHYKGIQLKPDWAELHYNLGDALIKINRIDETFTALQEAIRLKPQLAEAQHLLAKVLVIQGKIADAIPHFQMAIQLKPDWAEVYHNFGKALVGTGQIPEAIAIYQKEIAITSANEPLAFAYWDLGVAHWLIEQTPETIACFQKAVELHPKLADVHQGLCTLLRINGNFPACRQAADRYAKTCESSDLIRVLLTLVKCYLESGLNDAAQEYFQQLEAILLQPNVTLQDPEVRLTYEDLVFSLPYLRDRIDLNGHLNKLIGAAYTQLCLPNVPEVVQVLEPTQSSRTKKKSSAIAPLRIGIISKHFRRHSVGWCSRGIIKEWSKLTPHLHLYVSGRGGSDDITEEFKQMTPNFFDFSAKSNMELLEKLRHDNLDILIDMDSVMNPSHALILHHAPAKAVISWLGCEPPYLSNKNYYLCDRHTHPESVQTHYQEQLLQMPDFAVAIGEFPSKAIDREASRKDLGINPDAIAYLSVATGHKVSPESVRSHISILQQVPNSILIHKGFCDLDIVRSFYQEECLKAGIAIERCRFMTRQPLEEDHRLFYQVADIALDTYPYNGGTHNLESLWFNLPVVTLCGEQATSRMGYSFLKAVGITEGVAKNWDEYIAWGVKLGNNQDLRIELKQRLIKSKQKETLSILWNPQKFAIDSYRIFESL